MSRAMIVVTRHPTLQQVYRVESSGTSHRAGRKDVRGASAAAAEAASRSLRAGSGYQIFAPAEVLDCIPEDMRAKE